MDIKNKSLNRLLNDVIINYFKVEIEKLGFKHLKTKNSFQLKKEDLILNVDYFIDYWDKYYIDDDGELILNINFISSVTTFGFTQWFKKNYDVTWSFSQAFEKIKLYYLLENPNVNEEDFSPITPARNFKLNISKLIHQSSQTENDYNFITDEKDEIINFIKTNMIPNLLKNSNWEFLLNKIKHKKDFSINYYYVYLLFYLNRIEESREAFDFLLNEHYKKLENNEIKDIDEFKEYIRKRENEYHTIFTK